MAELLPSDEVLAEMWRSREHRWEALVLGIQLQLTAAGFTASRDEVELGLARQLVRRVRAVTTGEEGRRAAEGAVRAGLSAEEAAEVVLRRCFDVARERLDVIEVAADVALALIGQELEELGR